MPTITDPRDRLRLQIQDTTSPFLLTDDELDTFLAERDTNVLLAGADACDVLAARFAGDFDFKWKDGQFSRSQKAKQYSELAIALRARAAAAANPLYSFPAPSCLDF